MGLPSQNFVVVDMNMMRRPSVAQPLVAEYRRSGQQILLPSCQFYEMAKSEQAVSTFSGCVAPYLCDEDYGAAPSHSGYLTSSLKRPGVWRVRY